MPITPEVVAGLQKLVGLPATVIESPRCTTIINCVSVRTDLTILEIVGAESDYRYGKIPGRDLSKLSQIIVKRFDEFLQHHCVMLCNSEIDSNDLLIASEPFFDDLDSLQRGIYVATLALFALVQDNELYKHFHLRKDALTVCLAQRGVFEKRQLSEE